MIQRSSTELISAQDHKFVRPDVVEEPVIEVEGGRHPLVEMIVDRFVANDLVLSARDGAAFALVTGPNASGKSILLKQTGSLCTTHSFAPPQVSPRVLVPIRTGPSSPAGLLCYMAQIGSFVPASRARMGIVDRILARFHTRESATLPQGAFAADLAVVSSVVRDVTPRSLVLLDEFVRRVGSGVRDCVTCHCLTLSLLDCTTSHAVNAGEGHELGRYVDPHG